MLLTQPAIAEQAQSEASVEFNQEIPNILGNLCPITGYTTEVDSQETFPIPDDGSRIFGPITFTSQPGMVIEDLLISVSMAHAFVGQLKMILRGTNVPGQEVWLINEPGNPQGSCCQNLAYHPGNVYRFGDTTDLNVVPIGDGCVCVNGSGDGDIPFGCYLVAPDSPNGMSLWNGTPCGGVWELEVQDNEPGVTGELRKWQLHMLCEPGPVSVEEDSWGRVKAKYLD